jgi:TonB family protein
MSDAWRQWEGHVIDDRFSLRQFQGSSDHSAVFITTYGSLQEKAAIKLVPAPVGGEQALLKRWERTSKLAHPHLLRLFAWGKCNLSDVQFLFVVSEFAEENLGQILPSRPLTAQETEFMLRSTVEVLGYLHGAGLVHARLKPANLMAVGDDLKLASDSICDACDRSALPSLPAPYDAPELTTTGPSPAADVWSLGVTLTEALTQKVASGAAFRGGHPVLPEGTPSVFVEIAQECLRLDPERRWTSREIAAHLMPAPPRTKARSPFVPAAVGVVGLGIILVGGRLLWRQPEQKKSAGTSASAVNPVAAPATPQPDTPQPQARNSTADKSPEPAPVREAPRTSERKSSGASSKMVPGEVLEKVVPSVPSRSLDTITGKVRVSVRVAVDPSGHVAEASLASPGPSHYFARVGLEAARRWKFSPPMQGGEAVASNWMLRFAFSREGIKVEPAQLSP